MLEGLQAEGQRAGADTLTVLLEATAAGSDVERALALLEVCSLPSPPTHTSWDWHA